MSKPVTTYFTPPAPDSLFGWLTLLLSVAVLWIISTTNASAQAQSETRTEVIIAGHTVPHWQASTGSMLVTADSTGRLFIWEQRGDATAVVGARQLGEIDALAEIDGHIYLKRGSEWHRLALDDDLSLSERLSESQREDLKLFDPKVRAPIVTSHLAPRRARPVQLSSDGRAVITDMGRISLITYNVIGESGESSPMVDEEIVDEPIREPTTEAMPFDITDAADPSCASGRSYSVRGAVDGEPRQLLNRSCRRPYLFYFDGEKSADPVGILLVGGREDNPHSGNEADSPGGATSSPTVMRFNAALDHIQSVRLPDARFEEGIVRGTCLQSFCYLDIGSTETGWKWEKGRKSARAEPTDFALLRTDERVLPAATGWLRLQLDDGSATTIWLTDRGAASVCGASELLEGQVLFRSGERLYTAIDTPERCQAVFAQ